MQDIDGKIGTLKYIASCLDEIVRLQAEVARLKAAFAPMIELLESAERRLKDVEQWDHNGYGEPYNSVVKEIARLKAELEKGTECKT